MIRALAFLAALLIAGPALAVDPTPECGKETYQQLLQSLSDNQADIIKSGIKIQNFDGSAARAFIGAADEYSPPPYPYDLTKVTHVVIMTMPGVDMAMVAIFNDECKVIQTQWKADHLAAILKILENHKV